MFRKKTHEEYVAELAEKNPTVEVIGEYVGANIKIKHHCLTHDVYWNTSPSNALQGYGCSVCHTERKAVSQSKTTDQYILEVKEINPDIVVVGEYINAKTPIRHCCLIHQTEWMARPDNILHGKGCPECANENRVKCMARTHEEYVCELKEINPNITVLEKYINARTPILHKCLVDGYEWRVVPDGILSGHNCPKCSHHITRTQQEYIDELAIINPDIEVIGQYVYAITPILHKCKIDGNIWSARPNDILNGKGCPQCNESHGERQIRQLLNNHNIAYVPQKTFSECIDERMLPFDFYLPDYNMAIEYQGIQHYKPIEYFGGEKAFKKLKRHDEIKKNYCKENGILLLTIPYTSDIEEELNNFLFI